MSECLSIQSKKLGFLLCKCLIHEQSPLYFLIFYTDPTIIQSNYLFWENVVSQISALMEIEADLAWIQYLNV
jgi:hypothetical protein